MNSPTGPYDADPTFIVNEIFFSIQGESSFCGFPCVFIRLTGCNLRCAYCDTLYAFDEGSPTSLSGLTESIRAWEAPLVQVTGGEPLVQAETPRLVERLLALGKTVLVETNGSKDIRRLPAESICVLDMKCPSSGMSEHMLMDNLAHLRPSDEVKFVIQNREDYEWAAEILSTRCPPRPGRILFSPAHPAMPAPQLAEWILSDQLPVRLQVPLHRILWPDEQRGR